MSNALGGLPDHVPWTRFWIPRETAPVLDGDGYLVDPESDYGEVANPHARTLEQLEETPCVALLGEPGIGKSRVVHDYSAALVVRLGPEPLLSIDFRLHHDLDAEIFQTRLFAEWLAGRRSLTLLLDSLDEHPDGAYEVARLILAQLRQGPAASLRLRVACRTAEWPGLLDEQLPLLWKSAQEGGRVAFYALAPLRLRDVERAAGADASPFVREVARMVAAPLAIKPITLDFLLAEYRENRNLPATRVELYEEGCRLLCEERSPSREGVGKSGLLEAEQRVAVASRIAAICILSRRSVVQRGAGRVSANAVRVSELIGGTEASSGSSVSVTAEAIHDVLNVSGLFSPRGAGLTGWAHQTYAEFLAARFLHERGLPPDQLSREVSNLAPATATAPPLTPANAAPTTMPGTLPSGTPVAFPRPLLKAYGANQLALLVGSGLSCGHDVKGNFPSWNNLPARILDEVKTQSALADDDIASKRERYARRPMGLDAMLAELDVLKIALGRGYQEALRAIFRPGNAAPGDAHRALLDLGIGVIATTNYDHLLEQTDSDRRHTPYTWMESANAVGDINAGGAVLFKIHGTANLVQSVVMTRSEYTLAAADMSYQRAMGLLLQTRTFLLIGYSVNDPHDLDLVFKLNADAFRSAAQAHYVLMRGPRQAIYDRWETEFNVKVIQYQDHSDLPTILRQLKAQKP